MHEKSGFFLALSIVDFHLKVKLGETKLKNERVAVHSTHRLLWSTPLLMFLGFLMAEQ